MSWKPEIETYDEKGKFYANGTAFATEAEALEAGKDIYGRWTLAVAYRAVESAEPVNYRWVAGKGLQAIGSDAEPTMPAARVTL